MGGSTGHVRRLSCPNLAGMLLGEQGMEAVLAQRQRKTTSGLCSDRKEEKREDVDVEWAVRGLGHKGIPW